MKNKNQKRAFTLIELLVVVLIIGILSAIALPQYQKAVEKSRAAEALLMLKHLKQAGDIYLLEHPDRDMASFAELGIELSGEFTMYNEGDAWNEVACNKYWCYTTNGANWGQGNTLPDGPMAYRGTYDGDELSALYGLEYRSEYAKDTYHGEIVCVDDTKNYCAMFGTTDGHPIKM